MRPYSSLLLFWLVCTACGDVPAPTPEDTPPSPGPSPTATVSPSPNVSPAPTVSPTVPPTPRPPSIPRNTDPCAHPEYWPLSRASERFPILLHFQADADEPTLKRVMEYLDAAWEQEMGPLGFRAPLEDTGICGPDGAFDVFLWPDIDTCYVDASAPNPATPHEDYFSYMVLDAWGEYAGEILDSTLAHELNHASQAADDWWDSPIIFEMTSTLIEDAVFDEDDEYMGLLEAFQSRPDWSLDRNDYYLTWYMYGASLTLFFVKDRYFDGDFDWVAPMWLAMRNPPGAAQDPSLNEPDFIDALDGLLQAEAGSTFMDAVLELARWRYFTGARDDGAHFEEGALFPDSAEVANTLVDVSSGRWSPSPAPMLLGMAYATLTGAPSQTLSLTLSTEAPVLEPVEGVAPHGASRKQAAGSSVQRTEADVRFVIQAIPGLPGSGTDGELLGEGSGPFSVTLLEDGTRTLVVTVLPDSAYDPDTRTDERYPFTLAISPSL